MTDYLWAKTENVQKFLDNALEKQKQELIEEFLEKLEALEQHATHSNNPFTNLAWVKNAIKNEIKIYKKRLVEN